MGTLRPIITFVLLLYSCVLSQAQNLLYQHNFDQAGPGPYANPYVFAPTAQDSHLSNSKWTLNSGSWTSYNGVGGNYALAVNNASAGTKSLDLSFDVGSQYAISLTGVSFYHRSSSTGYNHWDLLINNINVASGSIFVDILGGSNPVQGTGAITFANPVVNLSGTIHAVLVLSGGAHGSNATFRFDQFALTGSVYNNPGGNNGGSTPATLAGPGIDGNFNVSDLGGVNYNVPIQIPAGINGMQPALSLSYSSQNGNGIMGMGWSLAGISAIMRVANTIYNDKNVAGVSLTASDRFALDGKRLIATSGTYGAAASQYHTENESFYTVTANGSLVLDRHLLP
ncbi:SpvB/TcaC N-terminal domain-containing protein [Taibaiella koreensis]|uniref:SpvB/TcaC N-terminal domain-containing protein n=1 Tax=Taibaiella koreensis TaxID=1268548 RepID=UPI0013C334DC|nr:SpvB/TcaC N-terminal domain-containing protein [Taibaiella koreensis]